MIMARPERPDAFHMRFEHDAEVLTVRLQGPLDAAAGARVGAGLRDALGVGPSSVRRVDIDLDHVASHTEEGLAALLRCRDLVDAVPDGVRYRATSAAGRIVLLATCRTDDALM